MLNFRSKLKQPPRGGLRRPLILLAGIILAGLALGRWLLGDLPAPTAANLRPIRPSTLILDRDGRLLYEVMQAEGKQTPLAFDHIPAACWQATVAVEDSRFFRHPGFDPLAIARATGQNLRQGQVVSGASTITQQLARNTLLSAEERYEQSLRRKLREAWLAWRIEQRFSKEEILALYHNQVYYGNFAYGLEAAAQAYFGKSAPELDLAECSLLAGLLQNPGPYNPLNNLAAARQRQATVLGLMVWSGFIPRQEAELALAERLQFAATPFPIAAPHFVSLAEGQLERLLGSERVSQGGLRVHTTLDLSWQQQAEAIVARRLQQMQEDPNAPAGRRVENAALVALDPQSGAILALVGSPDYFDSRIDGAVNGALALRQPGSAIKPITYAAALDPQRAAAAGRAPLTAATIIADVRTTFLTAEGQPYTPQNYDMAWHGPVSVRTALASSYNLPAVKVLDMIGVEALIDQAQRQGITTFRPEAMPQSEGSEASEPYGLALTLGGGEVSLLELTGAYAVFANGGRRVEPYAIERVESAAGELLFEAATNIRPSPPAPPRVLDERVTYLITDILADDDARAPAFGRNSVLRLACSDSRCRGERPAAVKTGTTTDWRDNWTVGYTPSLVTGVWVGNADNTPMLGVSGLSGAGPIWHDFMQMAHRNRPAAQFPQPQGLVRTEVCIDSGLLPTQWCSRRRSELFIAGAEPTEFDDVYRPVVVDACADSAPGPHTPPECLVERIHRVYPSELQEWARANGVSQPPSGSAWWAQQPSQAAALVLTSPDPNSVYRLSVALPAGQQRLRIAARPTTTPQLQEIIFLVNGQPVGSARQSPYETWWPLQPGLHSIGAVALDAAGQRTLAEGVQIEVR